MLPLVHEKEISGYNLELTNEFITRVNNNVGTVKCKMLKRNYHVPWLEETRSPYKFFVTRIWKEDM